MKAHALVPAEVGAERLVGFVLCHDVRGAVAVTSFRKGERLDPEAAQRLAATVTGEVHLLELEAGDLHEDAAGQRLASAVAGDGVRVREAAGGQWGLVAKGRGLLRVRVEALETVNQLEGISVYTLYDGQVVDAAEVVARAKVTPLVIAELTVAEAERRSRSAGGLLAVLPFRPVPVAAVAPATLDSRTRARFEAALAEKLAWFGAPLRGVDFAEAAPRVLAAAIRTALDHGARLLVVAGASTLDPLDPVFAAVDSLAARVIRKGVPAHPGSLLWLAELGGVPVLGMPSCGMFSQATLFDLILPRLLAGEPMEQADLAAFGHGGLLGREMAFRFPPYRAGQERGSLPD